MVLKRVWNVWPVPRECADQMAIVTESTGQPANPRSSGRMAMHLFVFVCVLFRLFISVASE